MHTVLHAHQVWEKYTYSVSTAQAADTQAHWPVTHGLAPVTGAVTLTHPGLPRSYVQDTSQAHQSGVETPAPVIGTDITLFTSVSDTTSEGAPTLPD